METKNTLLPPAICVPQEDVLFRGVEMTVLAVLEPVPPTSEVPSGRQYIVRHTFDHSRVLARLLKNFSTRTIKSPKIPLDFGRKVCKKK